jgi:hypothetical protein
MIWWRIGAAVAALAASFWFGARYSDGRHAARLLEAQKETMQAAEQASRVEAERLALQAERDELARALEDQAYATPDDGSAALSADRVRRLNLR